MKTQKERDAEKRREKLEHVKEQVKSGSLVVRQMTDEERERFRPRPRKQQRRS
jgi:hypothetical protein